MARTWLIGTALFTSQHIQHPTHKVKKMEYYLNLKITGKTEEGKPVKVDIEGKVIGALNLDLRGLENITLEQTQPTKPQPTEQPEQEAPSKQKKYERKHPPLSLRDKGRVYEFLKKGYTTLQIMKKMPHVDEWHIRGCKAYLTRLEQEEEQ